MPKGIGYDEEVVTVIGKPSRAPKPTAPPKPPKKRTLGSMSPIVRKGPKAVLRELGFED